MLFKIIILPIFIYLALSSNTTCAYQCLTCQLQNNAYSCLSCYPNNQYIYIFSCPSKNNNTIPFIIIGIFISLLHIFMLMIGIGVYRDIFQNIQLATLVTFRYGFQQGTQGLQLTNLAVVQNNSFPDTFGGQFIVVMIILGLYWLILFVFYRSKNNSMAILFKRKIIIFPTRIITFIFNICLYASMIQVTTLKTQQKQKIFALILASLALFKIAFVFIGLIVTCNWKRFHVDDPHYYVLLQNITVKRWYAKNNIVISLLNRGIIIILFVLLFQYPQVAGVLMLMFQILYTLYIIIFIRYDNIRYFLTIVFGNIFMIGIILVIYISTLYSIGSSQWSTLSLIYMILILLLVFGFFIATTLEMTIKRQIIVSQIKSFYIRFIKCSSQQDQILLNRFDENAHRQEVKQFHSNSLYQKQIPNNNIIELSYQVNKSV